MPISIVCPKCNTKSAAPDNAAGRNVKCPRCGVLLAVPSAVPNAPASTTTKVPIPDVPKAGSAFQPGPALGISSLVLGCLTLVMSLIPCIGMVASPLAGLGLLLAIGGIVVCVVSKRKGIALPVAGGAVNGLALAIIAIWAIVAASLSTSTDTAGKGNPVADNQKKEDTKGDPATAKKDANNADKKSTPPDTKDPDELLKLAKAAQEKAEAAEKRAAHLLAKADEVGKKKRLRSQEIHGRHAAADKEFGEKRQELAALKKEIEAAKSKEKDPKTNRPPDDQEEWPDASKSAAGFGDIRVKVTSVKIDIVDLVDSTRLQGPGKSKKEFLQINIGIENVSENKLIHYRGWGSQQFGIQPDLEDNFKNTYRAVGFGVFDHPVGQIVGEQPLYPGKSFSDVLVFDPAVKGAKFLRLKLPAKNVGGKGDIKIQIPSSMFGE